MAAGTYDLSGTKIMTVHPAHKTLKTTVPSKKITVIYSVQIE
jgi:hypothetical protein